MVSGGDRGATLQAGVDVNDALKGIASVCVCVRERQRRKHMRLVW